MAQHGNANEIIPTEVDGVPVLPLSLDGCDLRIGVVMSRFNSEICNAILTACIEELVEYEVSRDDIVIATVPGALELPLALQTMALSGGFDALIALGCVIRGETYHFEIVSNEQARGITHVALETEIPIANGVLTVENQEQAWARAADKGRDCARCVIEMVNMLGCFSEG